MKSRFAYLPLLALMLASAAVAQADPTLPTPQQAVEADLRKTVADLERRVKDLETMLALARSEARNDSRSLREGVQAALNVIGEQLGSMQKEIATLKEKSAPAPSAR
jgi:ElaB/YqjD/DUF883 family membrane-anchored ribosome-binding protein